MKSKPSFYRKSTNGNAGTKACDENSSKCYPNDDFKPSSDDGKKVDEDLRKDSECHNQEKEDNVNNTNTVNAASTNEVNVVGGKTSIELPIDPEMPDLEDIVYSDDNVGVEADMKNLDAFMPVSPIPTTRVHKDHSVEQIIGDLNLAPQTRRMIKNLEEHGYTQEEGTDYDEVFTPVARLEVARLFLAYASFKDFVKYQMDVKSAFLYEAQKEKEDLKAKVEKWHNSSKNLGKLLNTQMSANDKFGLGYGDHRYDGILSYENEVLQSVFMNKESELEKQPLYDRFVTAGGMHAVPPPMTGNYMPSGPDVEIDYSQFTYGPKQSQPSESETQTSDFDTCESECSVQTHESLPEPTVIEPKVVDQPKVWSDAPIIEEYESDSEDEHVSQPTKEQEQPSFASTNKQVKTPRETVQNQFTHSKNPRVDKKGLGYGFTARACFICGSLSHLIRDCDFHEKRMAKQAELNNSMRKKSSQREIRPIWNNVQRVNHKNQFVPTAVLTRTGKIPVNTARASGTNNVSTARHDFNRQAVPTNAAVKVNIVKPIVNKVRPANVFYKTQSPLSRPFIKTTSLRTKFSFQKVNTAEDYPHRALKHKGIVDSGCSRHMTGNKAYLAEYQDFHGGPVAFGGSKGYITGKGKIKTGKLDFEDVCFVKELQHFNLFSVSQICDKKNKVLFTDSECLVLSPEFKLPDENQVLLRIPRQNNMYSFNLENIVPSGGLACLIAKATIDESNKWHRRLGHVNFKNLNKLVKGNLVRGLPSKIFQNDHTCVACQKGKQHKASCKAKSVSSISHSLQLLHMDLFGPTSVRSLNHKTYCLVITDDFSRFSWVFFLRTKDETSGILKDFIRQIENQLNQKVKTIRCDNGTEFKNRDFIEFCGSKGIKREYSNARTPQQNGVAERKNRTLIEAARTMLADSFLPNTFWAEAVSTACYVLNRVLVTKPHNKTPYELITGKISIISYIRPFGCHVTILNTIDHLIKFDGKSDEGFLVGYSLRSKAFRVYNLETKRVEENLHITFLENKPNVAGKGPTWLFDLDYLTDSMNYQPVRSENQANKHAGPQEANHNAGTKDNIDAGDFEKEDESAQDYFPVDKEDQVFLDELERLKRQEKDANDAAEALRKEFGKVTPLFASMLVQPTEDEGAPSERPSEAQPTPLSPHQILVGINGVPPVSIAVKNPFQGIRVDIHSKLCYDLVSLGVHRKEILKEKLDAQGVCIQTGGREVSKAEPISPYKDPLLMRFLQDTLDYMMTDILKIWVRTRDEVDEENENAIRITS
ncbi:putative ribonuclease H-like domain-containing protein [Tanacetum coccineum]